MAVNSAMASMLGYEDTDQLKALNLAADIFEFGEYAPQLFDQPGQLKQIIRMEAHWRQA